MKIQGRRFRLPCAALIFALPASAHAISMSTGFATVTGNLVSYLLRMPSYEMGAVQDPAGALFAHIRFSSGAETGRRIDGECHMDASAYICAANYRFTQPVEALGVECTFSEITVSNHIHMLHADRAGKSDRAILDSTFPSATLAFRPLTPLEIGVDQAASGVARVGTNLAQILLLVALALAARSRAELALLFAAFVVGECAGTAALLRNSWQPPTRFAEAAAALALAYLALETAVFPQSGGRWLLALLFGGFQGMFFALFIAESGYQSRWVMGGAALGALVIAALCALAGFVILRAVSRESWRNALRISASCALLATGLTWFAIRLRS